GEDAAKVDHLDLHAAGVAERVLSDLPAVGQRPERRLRDRGLHVGVSPLLLCGRGMGSILAWAWQNERMPATFADYRELILAADLDAIAAPARIPPAWLLARAGALSAHYIPFDYLNRDARVVLVGIS